MLDRLTFLEEDVAWAAAAALAISGILFLWWGLWEDRSRGRRRCPRCRYDMAGVPGLVCPECGCDARRERRLFKTRRRWTAAALGLLFVLLAIAAPYAMPMYRHGWRRALPTWALLTTIRLQGWPTATNAGADPWTGELIRRYKTNSLGWSRDAAITAMTRHWSFAYRPKWPKDVPIVLRSSGVPWWHAQSWKSLAVRRWSKETSGNGEWLDVGPDQNSFYGYPASWPSITGVEGLPSGASHLDLEARIQSPVGGVNVTSTQFETEWKGHVRIPITITESVDECLVAVSSETMQKALAHGVRVTAFAAPRPIWMWALVELPALKDAEPAGVTVAMSIDLLCNGEPVASGRTLLGRTPFAEPRTVRLNARDGWTPDIDGYAGHAWQLRLRGDGALALLDFSATSYWRGEVVVDLAVANTRRGPNGEARVELDPATLGP